jgi:hypothetical protein
VRDLTNRRAFTTRSALIVEICPFSGVWEGKLTSWAGLGSVFRPGGGLNKKILGVEGPGATLPDYRPNTG